MLGVNYIVGPVRYGVVRVNKESCPSAPAFVSVRVALNAGSSRRPLWDVVVYLPVCAASDV